MGVLQRFERRLEGMVTGAFTKAFKAEVQPVEIAAALQRELDNNAQIVTRERSLVPNDFVIELGSHDHERLAPYEAGDTRRRSIGAVRIDGEMFQLLAHELIDCPGSRRIPERAQLLGRFEMDWFIVHELSFLRKSAAAGEHTA